MISQRGNRRIAAHIAIVNRQIHDLFAQQIAKRRFNLADGIVAMRNLLKAHHAVFVRYGGHLADAVLIEQAKNCTLKRFSVLIDLADHRLIGIVFEGIQRFKRIDKLAGHDDRHLLIREDIAIQRSAFLDRKRAIRNPIKRYQTVLVRYFDLQDIAVHAAECELHAFKRLIIFIQLHKLHAGEVIADRRVASDVTIGIHFKLHLGFVQLVSFRRVDLAEGIPARRHGNIGNLAVLVGVSAIDHFAIFIAHLDLRAGKCFFASDIRLSQRNLGINQFVVDRFIKRYADDMCILCFHRRIKRNRITLSAELPAIRRRKLPDVIRAMREQS